jgi:hypothetical protein
MTCFFFSSFKTLLTSTQGNPCVGVSVLTTFSLAGFQVTTIGRFWVTAEELYRCGPKAKRSWVGDRTRKTMRDSTKPA